VKAAQYLGCPPWELLERPALWLAIAEQSEAVEKRVQTEFAKRRRPF
jgi:hypothetical protein